ncbi:MAG: carboxypeptidase regulatory-like domain-containing protein, partial [Chloroflexi bacterium]|nr:carboxypeptidase regulatory-like domain-containing protein [Chloroflexota bacterium]
MNSRRPPLLRRWWPLIALIAVGLVLVAGKLSLRSAATGEPLIPGVAGAPVLGPQPTPTWTPGPGRVGLRVRVIDTRGEPVPQAIVEVRDGFNRAVGTQETGISGEALLLVPPDRSYVVTARKPGFQQGRIEEVQAPPAPAGNQSAPSGRSPGGDGGARVNIAVTRQQAPLVEIRLAAAESAVLGSAPRLLIGHNTLRISLIDAASNLLLKHSEPLGQGRVTLIAPAKDRGRLFASWLGSTEFLVLRTADLAVERKVALEAGGVTSLAVHPKTGRVWVATAAADTSDSGVLHELDPEAEQVLRRVPVGQTVTGMRFQPDGSALYLP